ncbi:hypothetical protein WN51_01204, partial [Melipona quadrifasciata]
VCLDRTTEHPRSMSVHTTFKPQLSHNLSFSPVNLTNFPRLFYVHLYNLCTDSRFVHTRGEEMILLKIF